MIRANTQPNQNTKLAGGGICDGLIFATTGGQSTGYIDFVSGFLPSSMSGAATAVNANGASTRPAAASGVISWPAGSTGLDRLTGPGTLLVCMRSNNNAGNWRAFGSREDNSTGDGIYLLYDDNANVTNGFNCGGNNNNYRANSNSNALGTNSEQSFHTFGFTWDGAGCQTYADGKPDKLTTGGNAAFTPNANSGRVTRIASGTAAADFLWAYAWNRVLSAAEVASITANPWQIFALPNRRNLANSLSGGSVTGTLAQALSASTLSASGSVSTAATLATTLGASTVAATSQALVAGVLAKTLASSTANASGAVAVAGTLAQTLGASTLAATGSVVTGIDGTLSKTLGASTSSGSGQIAISAALAKTLAASVVSASGVVGNVINGTLSAKLGNSTLVATSDNVVSGVLARTLSGAALTASGIVSGDVAPPDAAITHGRMLVIESQSRAFAVAPQSRVLSIQGE